MQQSTSNSPWDKQSPYLETGFQKAEEILNGDNPNYYPGSTVVGFSPETQQALSNTRQMAMDGSSLQNAGLEQAEKTVNGDYLAEGNPYMQQAFNSAAQPMIDNFNKQIAPGIDSSFAKAGRLGSNAYADARNTAEQTVSNSLSDLSGKMAYQNYGDERNRQTQFSAMAPELAQSRYNDANQLARVGAAREGQSQAELGDQVNRYNFEQNKDANKLREYMTLVAGGSFGGTSNSSQPVYSNPTQSFLGNASSGLGIASGFASLFG
ncbi:hypothetical protein [Kiloniella antarctica]|uniref:Peptidase S74 domain-containing protein n=1 Tax=Kiloniella antarctica TaxID=1550907 RepID=A0ABW5BQL7_9PROT